MIRRSFLAAFFAMGVTACAGDPVVAQSNVQPARPAAATAVPAGMFPTPKRPVASIIADSWSDEKARDNAKAADTVFRLLDIKPGMTVADVGAGSGYYVIRLSPVVGMGGRVLAEDIIPDYVERLKRRIQGAGLTNVTVILGQPHDPMLPPASVDLALLVHMYHEIEQPYALLYNLQPALRQGARVAIIDAERQTDQHGTPPDLLKCELAAIGYRQIAFHRLGTVEGYMAVFTPPDRLPDLAAIRACS